MSCFPSKPFASGTLLMWSLLAMGSLLYSCDSGEGEGTPDENGPSGAGGEGGLGGAASGETCELTGDLRPCADGGYLGLCGEGLQSCRENHTWSECSVRPVARDCASGEDNDCDGLPDNTADDECLCSIGEERGCQTEWGNEGECRRGTETCVVSEDGTRSVWDGACEGQVLPSLRVCGGARDNDCDGENDNVYDETCVCKPDEIGPCNGPLDPDLDGIGSCRDGTRTCVGSQDGSESSWSECAGTVLPTAPNCQSWDDDDCDGLGDYFACGVVVASGVGHACFINSSNEVRCWGCTGDVGPQDDNECYSYRSAPDLYLLGNETPIELASGWKRGCSLMSDKTVQCFPIGGSTEVAHVSPVVGLAGAESITLGVGHACSLLTGGEVACWGENSDGQLGRATDFNPSQSEPWNNLSLASPVEAVAGVSGATDVDAGYFHTCAVVAGGKVVCWGRNTDGQLGDGTLNTSNSPVEVLGVSTAVAVAAGRTHTCALLADETVTCWGSLGNESDNGTSQAVSDMAGVQELSVGGNITCFTLDDGSVPCLDGAQPWAFSGASENELSVSAGGKFACGVLGGKIICRTPATPYPNDAELPYITPLSWFKTFAYDYEPNQEPFVYQ